MEDSTAKELVEESEELPSENSKKSNLSSTSIDGSEAVLHHPSRPDLKALSFSVSFHDCTLSNKNFQSWTKKMEALHKPIWRKAGVFEAVMASTYKIETNKDLVLGVAERWSPDTKSFVFPWGETSITLEDVMVLLGFSVLGLPVFTALDSSGEKIKSELVKEWVKIKEDEKSFVTQSAWMSRFMDSKDELEHVAFLAYWLSCFVFPLGYGHINEAVLPIAVHLSCGTKIALAPSVLAHLYADLSLLKTHIQAFDESTVTVKTDFTALFKLVQVWTWERFRELQPEPNELVKDEPRLALWHEKQRKIDEVRRILDNSKVDSFEWRPFTKPVKNWEFPLFYPEKEMLVPVGPNLDDELISFARFIKVSQLVGIDYVEHYCPDRVALQLGMFQDVPCLVNKNNLSKEEAWDQYNKPIDASRLHIPSRYEVPCVSPVFCEWWKKTFQEILAGGNTIMSSSSDDDVGAGGSSSGSKKKKGSSKKTIGKVRLTPTDPGWPKDVPDTYETCELDWSQSNDVLREEVTHQGEYELCWAVALRESIEAALNINAKKERKNRHPKLSAQHLINNVNKLQSGAMRRYEGVTNFLVNQGLVTEDKCEYEGTILKNGCNHATEDTQAATKIKDLKRVKRKDINEKDLIKLVTQRPVVVEMRAFKSLLDFKGEGFYPGGTRNEEEKWNRVDLARKNKVKSNEEKLTLHALLLIGYGTINGVHYWLVKNSYGTTWGNGGYGKIIRQCSSGSDKSLFVKIRYPEV
ncbi:unnamed protein product [Arabis nemorensis]|uniref:Peptidase C1A papain C-terminal domain-containing protein n=1 Tax=Arabis nemorensis TaxID=586526 RepID=A0A565BX17_9BRAS|nr:unnamed protein product [Arabis nemorensis]